MKNKTWGDLRNKFFKDPKFRKAYFKQDIAFEIGQRVLAARIDRGWSQEKLAKKIGTLQPGIARIEGGALTPSLGTLQKIATALGMDLELPSFSPRKKKKSMPAILIPRRQLATSD